MGLTKQSTSIGALKDLYQVEAGSPDDLVIALAGNPNTGKSTVFNRLTGLNQHTGNWPGKTVTNAQGKYKHHGKNYILVDLPGTYSLFANSAEEQIARDFICHGAPDVTVIVTDATCLERNLNLVLQILETTGKAVVCVNLLDEAKRKGIAVDLEKLSLMLGAPAVGASARSGKGLEELKDAVEKVAAGKIRTNPVRISYDDGADMDSVVSAIISVSEHIARETVTREAAQGGVAWEAAERKSAIRKAMIRKAAVSAQSVSVQPVSAYSDSTQSAAAGFLPERGRDLDIDRILTSRAFGIPIMIALLCVIFWITIAGANVPSSLLADGLFWLEDRLSEFIRWAGAPAWIHGALVTGVYRTVAWVVSVMLPPMAIFFPLFTLLEDLGYLPRVAFNLDYYFKKACAHGKQALTMCMGFGCNAAGVIACRIIDSPRERLIATLTNNFVPCNGRFPTLIALSSIFIAGSAAGAFRTFAAAASILAVIVLGVAITLLMSLLLSKTILKGLPSSFTLELPPYRKPQLGQILVRSVLDRTLFVLGRAVTVAAPAGLLIWVMANVTVGDLSLLAHCARFLDPFAQLMGLDGCILIAFILGLPANEIVVPILIMSYMSQGSMLELDSLSELGRLFADNGWTWLTAVCMMLFSLNHWPCATTLWTIRKETQSWKWTAAAFLIPTLTGVLLCILVAQGAALLGLV
jgi:ferrous iron transport protein B